MGTSIKAMICGMAIILSLRSTANSTGTLTVEEFKGMLATGKATAKFAQGMAKCLLKCAASQAKAGLPVSDCAAPGDYAPNSYRTCLSSPPGGPEIKLFSSLDKATRKDCPECYSGGSPCYPVTGYVEEEQYRQIAVNAYCDAVPITAVLKCEMAVVKALGKLVLARQKCYSKCEANAFKGLIPSSSCLPPATDPATLTCLAGPAGTLAKAALAVDNACAAKNANPLCYGPSLDTGSEWGAFVAETMDESVAPTYCGSASGAFVE